MKLAKAEAIYRPNLLINGDFQVWQRGDSVSVATSQKGYTADRWLLQNNRTDVPITAYRIYDGSENPTIQQYYESYGSGISALTVSSARFLYLMDIEEAKKYEGKTVVLSYSLNKEITVNEPYTFTITEADKTNGYVQCFYRLMNIGEVLNWVKLEVGLIATPLVPRLYAEELLLCQRYGYNVLNGSSTYGYVGDGIRIPGNLGRIWIDIPIAMRTIPTLEANGTFQLFNGTSTEVNITSFYLTNLFCSSNKISINIPNLSSYEEGDYLTMRVSNNASASFFLDAEIK